MKTLKQMAEERVLYTKKNTDILYSLQAMNFILQQGQLEFSENWYIFLEVNTKDTEFKVTYDSEKEVFNIQNILLGVKMYTNTVGTNHTEKVQEFPLQMIETVVIPLTRIKNNSKETIESYLKEVQEGVQTDNLQLRELEKELREEVQKELSKYAIETEKNVSFFEKNDVTILKETKRFNPSVDLVLALNTDTLTMREKLKEMKYE